MLAEESRFVFLFLCARTDLLEGLSSSSSSNERFEEGCKGVDVAVFVWTVI